MRLILLLLLCFPGLSPPPPAPAVVQRGLLAYDLPRSPRRPARSVLELEDDRPSQSWVVAHQASVAFRQRQRSERLWFFVWVVGTGGSALILFAAAISFLTWRPTEFPNIGQRLVLEEGGVSKGGVNHPPATLRPSRPPVGQGYPPPPPPPSDTSIRG